MSRTCSAAAVVMALPVIVSVSSFASSAALAQTANLLPNPSFEEKAGNSAAGWKSRAWSGDANARWSIESPGRTGEHCLSIRSEKGSDAGWTAFVTVKPNTRYRLSAFIKTHQLRGATGALVNIQNMQEVKTPPVTGSAAWCRVSAIFKTREVTNLEINCLFGGWGQSTGQAWYDDVALEEMPAAPGGEPQAILNIDTTKPAMPYSRMIFGGFIEHFQDQIYGGLYEPGSPLSDAQGFRQDVIEALKELKLAVVHWPGGCFASGYHWKDGVGSERHPVYDVVWGASDPNTFGTDEFVEWCGRVGCRPYICTNAGNGTPEEMRDWVQYCNAADGPMAQLRMAGRHGQPLDVRYWSIGNENWGAHEIGARTPQEWAPLVSKSAELMRGAAPDLKLVAAATPDESWTMPLLRAAGTQLDYVAIHGYWLPCWGENVTPDYLSCIMQSNQPETTIARVIGLLDASGFRGRIKIAFDEWNLRGWHHPGFPRKEASKPSDPVVAELIRNRAKNAIASQYSMADALFSASFLNACLRHSEDVGMTNIAPIVNTRGPLYVHKGGLVKRTTFHVLAMYANELEPCVGRVESESEILAQGSSSVPVVDALVTVDESGEKWAMALVNRHPDKSAACTIRMNGALLDGSYAATILAGDSPDAYNDVEHPTRVRPEKIHVTFDQGVVRLPPHSLTIVKSAAK